MLLRKRLDYNVSVTHFDAVDAIVGVPKGYMGKKHSITKDLYKRDKVLYVMLCECNSNFNKEIDNGAGLVIVGSILSAAMIICNKCKVVKRYRPKR